MKHKKIILLLTSGALLLSAPLIAASCNQNDDSNKKTVLKFAVNAPWFGNNNHNFFKEIIKEFEKQTERKTESEVKYISENNDLVSLIKKGTSNIAVLTTPLFVLQSKNIKNNNMVPIIQTMTRAFKFEKNYDDRYSDGSENDKLRKIAKKLQDLFDAKPYAEWTNEEYQWDGNIYKYFYGAEDELVEHYRGLVMIQGTKEEREAIKNAWNSKDWNAFRNFGIITGKQTSGSKYILQEALFKKHFNLEDNKFISFAEDKLHNSDKYTEDKAKNIAKGALKKYHIVFDELASFAYTNNKKGAYYTPEDANVKIEFLTATDPLKYNVIVVDKNAFSRIEINTLKNIIINIWRDRKDDYGPTVGFNGYKIIEDPEAEVISSYNSIFN